MSKVKYHDLKEKETRFYFTAVITFYSNNFENLTMILKLQNLRQLLCGEAHICMITLIKT